jgi:predicted ATPase/DNA-binding CsgD family transcriptional regulator
VGAAQAGTAGTHGFPPVRTSFVGRAAAVSDVRRLLSEHRLVTVTGSGGMGKTRLAGEVARLVAGRFADGVWLAELALAAAPEQVAPVIAAAMGVPELPGVPAAQAVARALARSQLLLVLDNCEHVIEAVAGLCAEWLPAADELRILATSREPVGIAGELRYRLAPLTLPGSDGGTGASDAVALFADRARLADPHFRMTADTGPVVARLVERLDGMPLAIELAAARVEAIGVPVLLDRLDERLSLLTAADRLAPARHQSLRATVDWSYQLLGEHEQQVFRAISVFPAPFTLDGAEAVAGDGAGPVIMRLVDCSLLTPPHAGPDGRSRYQMLDTLRRYGADQLAAAGEQPAAAAALARYVRQIARRACGEMQGAAGELAAASWLDAEDPAIRDGLAWALHHDPAAALDLVISLAPWWKLRGRLVTGYPLIRGAAAHAPAGSDDWCAAQYWLGQAAHSTGDFETAAGHFTAIIDVQSGREPGAVLAGALAGRAAALVNVSRLAEGIDDARRAVALARAIGDPGSEALARQNLHIALYYAGDLDGALHWAREAVAVNPAGVPGWIARRGLRFLTVALYESAELSAARERSTEGLALARQAGDLPGQAAFLDLMADLDRLAGQLAEAGTHLHEALEIADRIGDPTALLNSLDSCGHWCAAGQRWGQAVTVWAAFQALNQAEGAIDIPPDAVRRAQPLERAGRALGPDGTRAAGQRGAAMGMTTAVQFALMLTAADEGAAQAGPLSPRERELIALVARGRTDAEIAGELYISVRTVRSHLDRIRDKTGFRRRADLTRLALAEGLV